MAVDFTCECDTTEERRLFRVTDTNGGVSTCSYCSDCAELAAINWTGETAHIEALPE